MDESLEESYKSCEYYCSKLETELEYRDQIISNLEEQIRLLKEENEDLKLFIKEYENK